MARGREGRVPDEGRRDGEVVHCGGWGGTSGGREGEGDGEVMSGTDGGEGVVGEGVLSCM